MTSLLPSLHWGPSHPHPSQLGLPNPSTTLQPGLQAPSPPPPLSCLGTKHLLLSSLSSLYSLTARPGSVSPLTIQLSHVNNPCEALGALHGLPRQKVPSPCPPHCPCLSHCGLLQPAVELSGAPSGHKPGLSHHWRPTTYRESGLREVC